MGRIHGNAGQHICQPSLTARSNRLICPATGLTVAESWAAERPKLTPLPEVLPEPFDAIGVRMVGIDCLVAFEGRQYSVPFAHIGERVEVRGCARCRSSRTVVCSPSTSAIRRRGW